MTRVKICGIMNRSDLSSAVSAGADAVGFIVEIDDSRHKLSASEAANLIQMVPVFTKSVAVIAPQDMQEAIDLASRTGADVLQVHGSLSPEELSKLKGKVSQKLVAAVPSTCGLEDARGFACSADAVLLDSMVNGKLGGTGAVHDWEQSARIAGSLEVPTILAGGLHPGNVVEAIIKVRPYAVDVSSGIETRGEKDPEKILSFIREVRSCPPHNPCL